MALVRRGLADGLRILAERHMNGLARFCSKFLVDIHAGQEMAQQTWLQIWANRERYEPTSRFAVFLYTVARNLCRNELRRRRRLGAWVEGDDGGGSSSRLASAASTDPDHLDALVRRERQRELLRALATIPEPQREAMLLRFDEELSYEEMSVVLGASESTLRSRVHHGIRALRAAMREES